MSNASGCYPTAKSYQVQQGSQSEQFRTVIRFRQWSAPARAWTDGCVAVLPDSQDCELSF